MWRAGQSVGEYELIAQLREGGMATLFLAKRSGAAGFSRHVAIKVIHPDLAEDEQFRQMFLDEALLSSRIQHPNVVHVEELGQHESAHFLVMEFVHGCSLSQLQRALVGRGRRLAPAFATRIAMHVADALHAAHETRDERGRLLDVVHRDVTPENVLLAYAGHVKLIDFGIAKAYGRRHRTLDGLLKGKFRYMAPEQALGKAVDRRVDIYQLGIVLWEMLTLRRLFDAEGDADLLQSVQRPRVSAPSAWVDRIPPALDAAVMAALAPDPRQRPADAQTFARTLARAMPSAHDVDSGALRALLLAAMQEQRKRDRGTYPPGVYDRLDQQVETLPLAGSERASQAAATVLLRHTLEHTAPDGSDKGLEQPAVKTAPQPLRRATFGSRRSSASEREFVRLERWRTTLTHALRGSFVASRALWLALGCAAAGAVAALLLVALATRSPRNVAPPALPRAVAVPPPRAAAAPAQAAAIAPPSASEAVSAAQPTGARAVDSAAQPSAGRPVEREQLERRPQATRDAGGSLRRNGSGLRKAGDHAAERAAGLVIIDGTPLASDPGF
jgi:serine/threonine-protein kinase